MTRPRTFISHVVSISSNLNKLLHELGQERDARRIPSELSASSLDDIAARALALKETVAELRAAEK